jgi:large subunit ribosomal protein L10
MKKGEKEALVKETREKLQTCQGSFLVDYKGLTVASLSKIRRELKQADAELKVIKNTLLRIASEGTSTEALRDFMKGPTAIAVAKGDVIQAAKALVSMAKEFQDLKLKAGQISGKLIDEAGIKKLSEIPGREVLLSQLLGTMQAVPAAFVRVLAGVMVKFLNVLKAIEAQRAETN